MTLTATILGCGSSGGVPRIGNIWGACDPNNPKNRRRRCSMLIKKQLQENETSILIDTGPDMREQLLDANVSDLDAVIITHEHADHVHGIDDLRVLALQNRRRVDVYMDAENAHTIADRFSYCFETPQGSLYPPILNKHIFEFDDKFKINGDGGDVEVTTFCQQHGNINSTGIRVGNLAYSSDVNDIPRESYDALSGLDIWIVDALRRDPHVTHFHLEQTLEWIDFFSPKLAILTNMHIDMDYDTLLNELPKGIIPAYDGMTLDF